MSLETSTFISGLTETWPVTGDPKSQGDDHIRLIKAVLKNTFPAGSKAFYFPTTTAISGTITLTGADQNNIVEVTTTGGNVTVNLPATLGVGDKGWSCDIVKVSNDANAAIVTPASGTIASKVGATATIRVGILCEPATLTWNGTGWRCSKPGPMIGTTENFDGATVPPGYLLDDGSVFSNTAFAELFAVLGTSTLKDKRGRTEIGAGTGAGLTNRVLGTGLGEETHLLSITEIPSHNHGGLTGAMNQNASHSHTTNDVLNGGSVGSGPSSPGAQPAGGPSGSTTPTNTDHTHNIALQGGGLAHNVIQPSLVVNKIKRAC
jgi:microcystin-dependent protein